jgi:hypothetical protein
VEDVGCTETIEEHERSGDDIMNEHEEKPEEPEVKPSEQWTTVGIAFILVMACILVLQNCFGG